VGVGGIVSAILLPIFGYALYAARLLPAWQQQVARILALPIVLAFPVLGRQNALAAWRRLRSRRFFGFVL
jgi:hypothetical protein